MHHHLASLFVCHIGRRVDHYGAEAICSAPLAYRPVGDPAAALEGTSSGRRHDCQCIWSRYRAYTRGSL